jgi:hypothetical protein
MPLILELFTASGRFLGDFDPMSALHRSTPSSALPPKADIRTDDQDVCLVAKSRHSALR